MDNLASYRPTKINTGRFLTAYTLYELERRIETEPVALPICSLGTPLDQLQQLAPLVLPPLYHEALDDSLKRALIERIRYCFPYCEGTQKRRSFRGSCQVVELERHNHPAPAGSAGCIFAFSVDTAVEEHGPHLPLATDTIQSYAVLDDLARTSQQLCVGPPVDYGHLVWGLPYGFSIDITPALLSRYVAGFTRAVAGWAQPAAIYVVDVHGSPVHRAAIQEGLTQSGFPNWAFRWLHEPLVQFAAERGDQHAGGVETALVHRINHELVDARWWPDRLDELERGQLSFEKALDLTGDLSGFIEHVEAQRLNGIVGKIRNFFAVDARLMFQRMIAHATADVRQLGQSIG